MPPKPQGDRAMTGAERVRRHRERVRAANPVKTDRQKLLVALERIRELEAGLAASRPAQAKPGGGEGDLVKAREEIAALRKQLAEAKAARPASKPAPVSNKAEPAMTLEMISTKTGREQAEIFMRQYSKRTEAEIKARLHAEYQDWMEDLLVDYRAKEKHYNLISGRWKGLMKKPLFNKFRMAVHPDSYRNLSTEDRNELSQAWEGLKKVMLKAEDAPTGPSDAATDGSRVAETQSRISGATGAGAGREEARTQMSFHPRGAPGGLVASVASRNHLLTNSALTRSRGSAARDSNPFDALLHQPTDTAARCHTTPFGLLVI